MYRPGVTDAPALPAVALEFPHERNERVDPLLREGVVNRRAHAADRAMTLQPVETRGRRLLDEGSFQILGAEPERDVHQRPAVLVGGAFVEAGAINFGVQF